MVLTRGVERLKYEISKEDKMKDLKICVWPDGEWCFEEDLEEALRNKSDDYMELLVSTDMDEDAIEEYVVHINNI